MDSSRTSHLIVLRHGHPVHRHERPDEADASANASLGLRPGRRQHAFGRHEKHEELQKLAAGSALRFEDTEESGVADNPLDDERSTEAATTGENPVFFCLPDRGRVVRKALSLRVHHGELVLYANHGGGRFVRDSINGC